MVTWLSNRVCSLVTRPAMRLNKLLDHHRRQVNRKAWRRPAPVFLKSLTATGQLKISVDQAVSPNLQVTALCHRSLVNDGPALLFENPQGFDIPVLGNLFGHEKRVLAALELENPDRIFSTLGRDLAFLRNPHLPESRQSVLDVAPGFAQPGACHPEANGQGTLAGKCHRGS